ncbi:MAG: LacI family DNA-binding transcriptional regulator, partial [Betaproteobacteria bacterium]|nr:LacI family DNA-binding transcriptional regulator [Betaproteobacteria bacterium]
MPASKRKNPNRKAPSSPVPPDIRRAVTSYDVALRAGISQSAVSRCFKPGASVSESMRARVMKAARELDYTPNALARSLITRRTNLAGVLISNLTNLYYPEVLSELSREFETRGMRVLLFTLPHEADVDEAIAKVWEYQVDGVVAAARLAPHQIVEFERRHVPLVLYNRTLPDRTVNAVVCDQIEAARLVVSRLAAAGHKRFGIIGGPPDSVVGLERVRGARERIIELGLREPVVVPGNYDY